MKSWNIRDVTRNADANTGPRSAGPHQIILAHFDRVRNANNRLVLAETEKIQAEREWTESRHALVRMIADYGVEGLVDGERPPQVRGTDDE